MGKSPAKWIKTVLFGKRSSKSNISKGGPIEKKESNVAKASSGDLALNSPATSHLAPQISDRSGVNTELEKRKNTNLPCDADNSAMGPNAVYDAEIIKQEEAATKAQAAFRGYLARRAFRALKGIIRLQALVRGHLVRRQAVATLRCMQAIVKLQTIVRAQMVRVSDEGRDLTEGETVIVRGVDAHTVEKLITNPFIWKLLASSSTAMPLSLQYDPADSNSVNNWLERWSSSRFWKPLTRQKKILGVKPQKKQANMQSEDSEAGKARRAVRKLAVVSGENSSMHSSESEKSKRTLRKVLNHQTAPVQEQPQSELERVKRNLRKVSASATVAPDKLDAVVEKPQQNLIKVSTSSTPDNSEQRMDDTSDKIRDTVADVSQQPVKEICTMPLLVDELLDVHPNDQSTTELHSPEFGGKVESTARVDDTLSTNDDQISNENPKTRRKSFPTKQEYPENVSQNVTNLPSYMAATESAKAKVKAQGSPRPGDDGADNAFVRRHSLPLNGKLSLLSPQMQKPVLTSGKGGSKSNRALTSSRDEKALQPGWRR